MIELFLAGVWGYLLGAVPTGVLVCRALRREDVRQRGSGHTGGLNVSRTSGIWAGVLTVVVDALLGMGAVAGATLLTDNPRAATAAGVMAVVGHNWSVFIHFGGGIGLSTVAGVLLYLSPLATLGALPTLALLWLILVRLLHVHRARATILIMAAVGPLLWALGLPPHGILLGTLGGAVVILKTLPDWNRQYE
ncbi:MAG TPA: glycerol-3-phosphate acyltransferase [Anaerolineae bacterium]|nr:glycerol-3-phosphate acyltransferase [Anaerolineae bacterium]